jgi:hypothetical protein
METENGKATGSIAQKEKRNTRSIKIEQKNGNTTHKRKTNAGVKQPKQAGWWSQMTANRIQNGEIR